MDRLIEWIILSYHTPLYLKNSGRNLQVSKTAPPPPVPAAPSAFYKSGHTDQTKNGHFHRKSSFLVSLAVSFEVEKRMIAQNDPLDEAVHPRTKFFFGRGSTREFLTLSRKNSGFSAKIKLFW